MNWTESAAQEVAAEMTRQAKTWYKANQTMEGFRASPFTISLMIRREWEKAPENHLSESDRSNGKMGNLEHVEGGAGV